jgi:hypothetical protein
MANNLTPNVLTIATDYTTTKLILAQAPVAMLLTDIVWSKKIVVNRVNLVKTDMLRTRFFHIARSTSTIVAPNSNQKQFWPKGIK